MSDRVRRAQAAPLPPVGDVARRKAQMPGFSMDVGTPPELHDPESEFNGVNVSDLVDLNPQSFAQEPALPGGEDPFYANLLGKRGGVLIDEAKRIVTYLDQQFERDKEARENSDKIIARGIQEAGYDRNDDVRTSPFPGASAVVHPMFAQAATDFSSRTIRQLFPTKGPIKTEVQGKQSEDDIKRADKCRRFLNWLLTIRCRSYRGESDKLFTMLPFVGDCLKKLYWEETEDGFGRPKPEFVLSDKFIIPYAATDLADTPRYAHDLDIWPERVQELMDSGMWRKFKLSRSSPGRRSQTKEKSDSITGMRPDTDLNDTTIGFRECHVDWYFPSLHAANEQAKMAATKKPQQQQQPGQGATILPFQKPGAGTPPAPGGMGPQGLPMVDLGAQGQGQPAQPQQPPPPETDPDAVKASEVKPEPGGDDRERNDVPNTGAFPGGPKLSYIITYHIDSKEPVAIRRNWKKTDVNQKKRVWFSHYVMFPWRSWNGLGLWHLIGGLAKSATGTLRALLDSAVIDNMPGGVRLANSRMSGDDVSYRPMEYAKINAPGVTNIRDVMMPYPKNPTAPVLFDLLKAIVQWGSNFATTATQEIMDLGPNTPATSVLQIIEHAGAIYSSIYSRLHAAQEREFELLAELVAENLPEEGFAFSDQQGEEVVKREDFENVKISPVSDPDTFSELQRSMRAQAAMDLGVKAREMGVNVDMRFIFVFYAQTLGLPDVDKMFPEAAQAMPRDPVSELFAVVKGQPADAFPGQNHKAHVAFASSVMRNPIYQQIIAPVAPAFLALVNNHVMFMLKEDIEQTAGGALQLNQPLPPDQQFQIAQTCAEIMQQMTDDLLTNGPDQLLQQVAVPGALSLAPTAAGAGAPGQGGTDPATERAKIEAKREETASRATQHTNDQMRKLAEKEAEIKNEQQMAMFTEEMEDRRNRREVASKLIIHFTTLEQERNMSVHDQAAEITRSVNEMMGDIFDNQNQRAHEAAEAREGRAHDVRKMAFEHGHAERMAGEDRDHAADQAELDRYHDQKLSEKAAKAKPKTDGD